MKPTYKVVDLFCGGGGFSRGFEMAGFKVVAGVELVRNAVVTFATNFPHAVVIMDDVRNVTGKHIIDAVGDEPDVVIGGPPCEPFTRVNPRRRSEPIERLYDDELGQLVLHFIRLVGELKPKVFVMENVVDVAEGELRKYIAMEFKKVGYDKIYFNVLRAEDYGTPSQRRRMFISNVRIKPPKAKRKVTVWEAIGDLPEPDQPHDIPNHEYTPVSPRKQKRMARLKWGEALTFFKGATGTFKNYIKLHPHKPAPTVMGTSRFIHPFRNRLLTVRENARLMGFPDNHIFIGGKEDQYNMVGEAVPPPLAKAIAQHLLKKLKEI